MIDLLGYSTEVMFLHLALQFQVWFCELHSQEKALKRDVPCVIQGIQRSKKKINFFENSLQNLKYYELGSNNQ